MTLDPGVFKAYDVRGVYPNELDEEGAYAVGRAFVEEFEPRKIAVGRDMRTHAPAMAKAVISGALDAGADVIDVGMVGTEMLYFAVGSLELDVSKALATGSSEESELRSRRLDEPPSSSSSSSVACGVGVGSRGVLSSSDRSRRDGRSSSCSSLLSATGSPA